MKKLHIINLILILSFCSVFADNENYDGKTVAEDFSGQSLNYSSWESTNVYDSKFIASELKEANFNLAKVLLVNSAWTICDIYITDFTNANLENAKLTSIDFVAGVTTGRESGQHWKFDAVSFAGANLKGANFSNSKLVLNQYIVNGYFQFYNGISLDLSNQNLMNCVFENCILSDGNYALNLKNSDLRGANFTGTTGNPQTQNTIWNDGFIKNPTFTSETNILKIRKFTSVNLENENISSKINTTATMSGGSSIVLENGANFEISNNSILTVGETSKIVINSDINQETSFIVQSGSNITFDADSILEINLDLDLENIENPTFKLIDFFDASSISGFENLKAKENVILKINGTEHIEGWNLEKTSNSLNVLILKPVEITSSPESLEKYETESAYFCVNANGSNLQFQWQYSEDEVNWVDIVDANSDSLVFLRIENSDAGFYRCIVSNDYPSSEISSSAQLNIRASPFERYPADAVIRYERSEISNVHFIFDLKQGVVVSENNPYRWEVNEYDHEFGEYKGWTELTDEESISGSGTRALTIKNIQPVNNKNKYRCHVRLSFGEDVYTKAAVLTVYEAPNVVTQPSNFEVFTGKSAELKIDIIGNNVAYQWYKNDKAIEGATDATLLIENVSNENSGDEYFCIVLNDGISMKSKVVATTVHQSAVAGTITKDLVTIKTVADDGFARFEIETSAYNPTYEWSYLNSENVWVVINSDLDERGNILFIPALSEYNRKQFKCKISNAGGSVESSTQRLIYADNAIQIISQPQNLTCTLGSLAKFSVSATTSTGEISYKWQHSKDAGSSWVDIENSNASEIEVEMDSYSVCGLYRVEIDNCGGVLYSVPASLDVTINVISQPQDAYAFKDKETKFELVLENATGISYQWQLYNGTDWEDVPRETSSILTLTMAEDLDGRQYRCLYSTESKTFESGPATLHLKEDVKIVSQPVEIPTAQLYSTVEFVVKATGYEPQFKWQVLDINSGNDYQDIAGATSNVLTVKVSNYNIPNLMYRCIISNENSTATSNEVWIENVAEAKPYDAWVVANNLTGGNAKPEAKPFNDGITNLEKFVFGLDGSRAASYSENPSFKQSSDGANAMFEFPLNKEINLNANAASGIAVKAKVSTDLKTWTEATATKSGESGNFNLYKLEYPIPPDGKLFFKLDLEQ